jgi:TonB family protein
MKAMVRLQVVGWAVLMGALALPIQAAHPQKLKPAGNPGDWITSDDYPPVALRAHLTGISGFRLNVDTTGHVAGCTITSSSGSADLDQTTCQLLTARASFLPAMGRNGRAIAGTYSSAVRWQIPHGSPDKMMQTASMTNCVMTPNDIHIVTVEGCL